jgi:uncharacterized protein (UPF0303 family)
MASVTPLDRAGPGGGGTVDETGTGSGAPTIAELEEQERLLVLPAADIGTLHALGARMYEAAIAAGLPIAIQVRLGERLVYAAAAPGSTAVNDEWAARKSRVVHLFEQSSLLVRLLHERDGVSFDEKHRLAKDRFAAHGGAFPLRIPSVGVVGSVVVSGLPQVEDHAFVVRILGDHLRAS